MRRYVSFALFFPVLWLFFTHTHAASTLLDDIEGTLRSEYLVSYRYDPLPEGWEGLGTKEKSQSACQYALGNLGEKEGSKFTCEQKAIGDGATSNIFYSIKLKEHESEDDEEAEKFSYFSPVDSIRLLVNYHYRGDGRLPYYKDGVFGKKWIESRYSSTVLGDADLKSLHVIAMASVLDKANNIDLHIVSRTDSQLRISSWILRKAFDLFESDEDKLQSEMCLLLQKMSLPSYSKLLEKRLTEVENEISKLTDESEA